MIWTGPGDRDFYEALGREIRENRIARGYTVQELSKILGVSETFLLEVELGKRKFHCHTLNEIINALDEYVPETM